MTERRVLARQRTFIKGRIYFNNRMSSVDCIVRDVADNGARLEVPESVVLPDTFELYFPSRDEHFHARVEWRRAKNVGVSWTTDPAAKHHGDDGAAERSLADRVAKLEREVAQLHRRLDGHQEI
jgi:hypothetical protein